MDSLLNTPNLNLIAIESASNPFTMMNSVVGHHLGSLSEAVSEQLTSISKRLAQMETLVPARLMNRSVKSRIEKANFTDLAGVNVPVPKGLQGSLLHLTHELTQIYGIYEDILETTIEPTDEYLSKVMAHPDKLGSLIEEKRYKDIKTRQADSDQFKAHMAELFDPQSSNESLPYSKAFSRNTDYVTFQKQISDLARLYKNRETTKVTKAVNQLAMKSDMLYNRIQKEDIRGLTNGIANDVAVLLNQVAYEIDMYSSILINTNNLIQVASNIDHHLDMVLK